MLIYSSILVSVSLPQNNNKNNNNTAKQNPHSIPIFCDLWCRSHLAKSNFPRKQFMCCSHSSPYENKSVWYCSWEYVYYFCHIVADIKMLKAKQSLQFFRHFSFFGIQMKLWKWAAHLHKYWSAFSKCRWILNSA